MNRVKELMDRAGMQQKELAAICHVSGPTVSDWVRNKKNPSGENLKKLSEMFKVGTGVILGYDEIPRSMKEIEEQLDDDAWAIRERLRRDPNYRLLFDTANNATPEHLRAAAAMLKALEPREGDQD